MQQTHAFNMGSLFLPQPVLQSSRTYLSISCQITLSCASTFTWLWHWRNKYRYTLLHHHKIQALQAVMITH